MANTTELKLEFEKLVLKERVNSKHIESWIYKKFGEGSSIRPILSETFKEIYLSVQSEGEVPSQRQLIQISYMFYGNDPDFILKDILLKHLYWDQLEQKPNFFFPIDAKLSFHQILPRLRKEDIDYLISFIPKIFAHKDIKFPFLEFLRLLSNASDDLSISIRTELDLELKKILYDSDSSMLDRSDFIGNLLLLELYLDQKSLLSLEELTQLMDRLLEENESTTLAVLSLVLTEWQKFPENFNTYQVAKKYLEVTKKMIFEEKLFSFIKDEYLEKYLIFDSRELVISLFPFLLSYDQKRILNSSSKDVKQEFIEAQARMDYRVWEISRILKQKSLLIEKANNIKSNLATWGIDVSQEITVSTLRKMKGREVDVYDLQSEIRDELSLCNPVSLNFEAAKNALIGLSKFARRSGLLAIEDEIAFTGDPFLQLGLQSICDGTDPDEMKYLLDPRIKGYIDAVERYYSMLKIGIMKIQEGTNPRILRQILDGYMRDKNVTGVDDSD
ncbi:MAG: hypothetical protein O9264_13000 [Leptospira sp.]|nr:hypothetical protein [Leptospira sp.]